MVRINPFKREEPKTETPQVVPQPVVPTPPVVDDKKDKPEAGVEDSERVQQVVVEREINLALLNEKLNYIIEVLNGFK